MTTMIPGGSESKEGTVAPWGQKEKGAKSLEGEGLLVAKNRKKRGDQIGR